MTRVHFLNLIFKLSKIKSNILQKFIFILKLDWSIGMADMMVLLMNHIGKIPQIYIGNICSEKCYAVALHGVSRNWSCYVVSDLEWLTQMNCPVPSAQTSIHNQTTVQQSRKMLYDVTFAHRFWRGMQMIVCEQTRLRAVVLVGCFIRVCLG